MSDSSHADTIRYYLSDEFDDYSDAFAALDALLAENQQLREALRTIIAEPDGGIAVFRIKQIARAAVGEE